MPPLSRSPSQAFLQKKQETRSSGGVKTKTAGAASAVGPSNPILTLPSVAVGAICDAFGHVATATAAGGKAVSDGAQNAAASVLPACKSCACVVHRRRGKVGRSFRCAACGGDISKASDIFMALDQTTCSNQCQLVTLGNGNAAGGWQVRLPTEPEIA